MAPRRVAADLANIDGGEDDVQNVRTQRAAGDDDVGDDDTDDEADDEQEDDDIDGGDDEVVPPRRQQHRSSDDAETRAAAAEARAAAAEQRAIEAEERALARSQPAAPTETPEQERARTALMSPDELIDYRVNKALERHQQTTQAMVLSSANTSDKAAFAGVIRDNPAWRKHAPEVEKRHAALVKQGQYPTRETVLTYLLGELAMKTNTQREGAQRRQRVEGQRAAPLRNGSEVQPQRRGGSKTAEERLDGVPI